MPQSSRDATSRRKFLKDGAVVALAGTPLVNALLTTPAHAISLPATGTSSQAKSTSTAVARISLPNPGGTTGTTTGGTTTGTSGTTSGGTTTTGTSGGGCSGSGGASGATSGASSSGGGRVRPRRR